MPEPAGKQGENTPNPDDTKVTFDDKQKAAINEIVEERLGRERRKHKEVEDALKSQIEELKSKPTKKEGGDGGNGEGDADLKNQFQRLLNDQKNATKAAEDKVKEYQTKLSTAEQTALQLRKDIAFVEAADGVNLVKGGLKTLKKLVADRVEWDADKNTWVARAEDGSIELNDSMKPASLGEFIRSFTATNDFLLNGDVKPGSGATESSKNGGNFAQIKTKADFATDEEKVAYIKKFGAAKYAKLPLGTPKQ